jgi:hypothetical protein
MVYDQNYHNCSTLVVKTILDYITAIREVGSVSLSQPGNLWEKVMEIKAPKAARLAITSYTKFGVIYRKTTT